MMHLVALVAVIADPDSVNVLVRVQVRPTQGLLGWGCAHICPQLCLWLDT
jgi:hypothetical protein